MRALARSLLLKNVLCKNFSIDISLSSAMLCFAFISFIENGLGLRTELPRFGIVPLVAMSCCKFSRSVDRLNRSRVHGADSKWRPQFDGSSAALHHATNKIKSNADRNRDGRRVIREPRVLWLRHILTLIPIRMLSVERKQNGCSANRSLIFQLLSSFISIVLIKRIPSSATHRPNAHFFSQRKLELK